jgi:hypothetical protein
LFCSSMAILVTFLSGSSIVFTTPAPHPEQSSTPNRDQRAFNPKWV